MDTLRLTLLIVGIAFIAALYLVLRLKSDQPLRVPRLFFPRLFFSPDKTAVDEAGNQRAIDADEPDPLDIEQLSKMTLPGKDDNVDTRTVGYLSALPDQDYTGDPLIIVLSIMAKKGQTFSGLNILDALLASGMQHGEMQIFHRYVDASQQTIPVCSLANAVEPGMFDIKRIEEVVTPGLSLFMQLPGPLEGREAFDIMLKTGRSIAEQLGGELCDDTRSVLTMQTIGHIKEKIEAFSFKQKMSSIQKHRH